VTAPRYRTGRRQPRTIYQQLGNEPSDTDPMVGSMDTAELAAFAVAAMNGAAPAAVPVVEFDAVKAPAAVAKVYVIAALNEVEIALKTTLAKYKGDLSGDQPFALLLAAEKVLAKRTEGKT
jgi:hypothetical protein